MARYFIRELSEIGIIARGDCGIAVNDGDDDFIADPGELLITPGNSFHGKTWNEINAAVATGYIDV